MFYETLLGPPQPHSPRFALSITASNVLLFSFFFFLFFVFVSVFEQLHLYNTLIFKFLHLCGWNWLKRTQTRQVLKDKMLVWVIVKSLCGSRSPQVFQEIIQQIQSINISIVEITLTSLLLFPAATMPRRASQVLLTNTTKSHWRNIHPLCCNVHRQLFALFKERALILVKQSSSYQRLIIMLRLQIIDLMKASNWETTG